MYSFFKRTIDMIISFFSLILFSPLFLLLAIMIKIDSKGPVIFKQKRLGKNGKVFNMYKFRSMVVGAEHMGTGLMNYEGDNRITKVGKFLRTTSLDELPQLFNILKGDMSLIGPRPPVEYELGDYDTLNARYKKRFQVRPGITGLAQVSGRNDICWDKKVNFDGEYVDLLKKKGFVADVKIFFKTIAKIFAKEDIYENKDENLDTVDAAEQAAEEVIRLAHLPEEIDG